MYFRHTIKNQSQTQALSVVVNGPLANARESYKNSLTRRGVYKNTKNQKMGNAKNESAKPELPNETVKQNCQENHKTSMKQRRHPTQAAAFFKRLTHKKMRYSQRIASSAQPSRHGGDQEQRHNLDESGAHTLHARP